MTEVNLKETIAYTQKRADNIVKYSDKLSEMIKSIDKILIPIFEKNGLEYIDNFSLKKILHDYFGNIENFLKIGEIKDHWGILITIRFEEVEETWLSDASRSIKKEAIKRLPKFLQNYAEFLKKEETEYREVSELAEKINDAIK